MGASFRTKEQVIALAGCDFLTISPQLLKELEATNLPVERKLDPKHTTPVDKIQIDEKNFRWLLNEDEMAGIKLSEGIRKFAADIIKLEEIVKKHLQ